MAKLRELDMLDLGANHLESLLGAARGVPVAVIGDYSLDRYGTGEVKGTSRETGQAVNRLWSHAFNPGGAGNVAWNFADLGGTVRALTVVGSDAFASVMETCLAASGVDTRGFLRDRSRITGSYEKLRIRQPDGDTHELRVDVDNQSPVSARVEAELLEHLDRAAALGCTIVAADYNEEAVGVLGRGVAARLRELAEDRERLVAAISRTRSRDFAPAMSVVNEYEACHATGLGTPGLFEQVDLATVRNAGETLAAATRRPSFVTLGERGILVTAEPGAVTLVATAAPRGEIDITGAGDSALAGIVLALAARAEPPEAAAVGNLAAYVTIHKLDTTGTATAEEILDTYRDLGGR